MAHDKHTFLIDFLQEKEKETRLQAKEAVESAAYNPFGRPGAGAPVRDSGGAVRFSCCFISHATGHTLADINIIHTYLLRLLPTASKPWNKR
jgi:hypothetical protein